MKVSLTILSVFFSLQANASFTSYEQVKEKLHSIAASNPAVQLITIGASDSGDTILGLKIGKGALKNLVVGTHHGNEFGSTEVAVAIASSLAQSPIEGQTNYVIPVLNIGGYNQHDRYETAGAGYHDPNRDYPGPCATEGPFTLKSTRALATFVDKENIVNSATLHTYYPAVVWPWGISTRDLNTPYTDVFKQITANATKESGYQTGNSTEVIYAADGTFEDYAFWKHGIWSILFELGFSHNPSESDVQKMIDVNVPGIRRMLANAPMARAADHDFRGKCDLLLRYRDRHDE